MVKVAFLSVVLLLAGCAALGVPPANTFNKRAVVANATIESSAVTVKKLYATGKLTAEEANDVVDNLQVASNTVDGAVLIYKANPAEAETRLEAVILGLQTLQTYLRSKQ